MWQLMGGSIPSRCVEVLHLWRTAVWHRLPRPLIPPRAEAEGRRKERVATAKVTPAPTGLHRASIAMADVVVRLLRDCTYRRSRSAHTRVGVWIQLAHKMVHCLYEDCSRSKGHYLQGKGHYLQGSGHYPHNRGYLMTFASIRDCDRPPHFLPGMSGTGSRVWYHGDKFPRTIACISVHISPAWISEVYRKGLALVKMRRQGEDRTLFVVGNYGQCVEDRSKVCLQTAVRSSGFTLRPVRVACDPESKLCTECKRKRCRKRKTTQSDRV